MEFGDKLRSAITAAGYPSLAAFARELDMTPQRLGNYIALNRVPDALLLERMARKLNTTSEALLNGGTGEGLRDILLRLCELEGIPEDRADNFASAFLAARRLLATSPDDAPLKARARLAAQFAWQSLPRPRHDTQ